MDETESIVLEHIKKLLRDAAIPPLTDELARVQGLEAIHNEIIAIREVMYSFSQGDFSPPIRVRGIIPGCMKALQAKLLNLIWQVQQVAQGDFSQRVEFMGDFSEAFNSMTSRLEKTLSDLQKNESKFKFLASHDPLTGALNRRSFLERAALELHNAQLLEISCGLIMMDIDHFKLITIITATPPGTKP